MKPGTIVKLRPVGPWRCGPDSGARNQVDPVYHSDSVFSAVTSAIRALGQLDEWLEATARNPRGAAVRFSSCFPFHEDIGYVIPPRSLWPPTMGAAAVSAKVRWKAARYVPVTLVAALAAGQAPDEDRWMVDGPSECLVPAGRPGPFRTALRSGVAVDRMSGAIERHATACMEFLPGAGLWTVVSFADGAQHERWSPVVRAAFRLLADSGLGGERSRGWGRAEEPEFIDGMLPEMILPPRSARSTGGAEARVVAAAPEADRSNATEAPVAAAETPAAELSSEAKAPQVIAALTSGVEPASGTEASLDVVAETPGVELSSEAKAPQVIAALTSGVEPASGTEASPDVVAETPGAESSVVAEASPDVAAVTPDAAAASETALPPAESELPVASEPPGESAVEPVAGPLVEALAEPQPSKPGAPVSHWLLSLFSPASGDAVDWTRGNYSIVTRSGRIESPARSGELKKQVNMVAEGSVLVGGESLEGAARDVAPDGFPHPVYRAGFALAIPLPAQVTP